MTATQGTAMTDALARYNRRRRPRSQAPELVRAIVLGAAIPTHGHGISLLYIDRFKLTALVPDPRLENAGDDAGLPEHFEAMSGENDHRVATGGGSKTVVWMQPGHVLDALRVGNNGRFGIVCIEELTGNEDEDTYNRLQAAVCPPEALLDENGEEIVRHLHAILDRRFREIARQTDDALVRATANGFLLANNQAYTAKRAHLKLTQGEILRTRNGAAGRTVMNDVEERWAAEADFSIDASIDIVGRDDAINAYEPPQQTSPVPPINIVLDEAFLDRAVKRGGREGGVSEARFLELLEQTRKQAMQEALKLVREEFRQSPEYQEMLKHKAAPTAEDEAMEAADERLAADYVGPDTVVYDDDTFEVEVEVDNPDGTSETLKPTEPDEATETINAFDAEGEPDEEFEVPDDDEPNPLGEVEIATEEDGGVDVDRLLEQSYATPNAAAFKHVPAHQPGKQFKRRTTHRPTGKKGKK